MRALPFALLCACAGPVTERPLRIVDGPKVLRPDNPDVHLARVLEVSSNRRSRLRLDVDGRALLATDWGTSHRGPLLGLRADTAYEVSGVLFDEGGREASFDAVFETPVLPVVLPELDVLAHNPSAAEPGHTLIGFHVYSGGPTVLVIYDEALAPIWVFDAPDPYSDLRMNAAGNLFALSAGDAVELDLLGRVLRRWTRDPTSESDILWEGGRFFYDFLPLEEGFASITFEAVDVPAFPSDYAFPETLDGPVDIRVPNVVTVGYDGALIAKWPLSERLDTTRISYNSLNWHGGTESWDWAHANAVATTPDGFLVSLRHQDAVVKLDRHGSLQWILGDHAGWSPDFAGVLLQPQGDLQWPYHQHAPMRSDDGEIVLFDNHNRGYTPYAVPDELPETTSRVVAYRVDPVAMTVEQTWSYSDTVAGTVTSPVMGDADWLASTGNVLATFASTTKEAGVRNEDQGWGENAVRLIEVSPGSTSPALDVRFYSDGAVQPEGWWAPRAERIPSLYGPGAQGR